MVDTYTAAYIRLIQLAQRCRLLPWRMKWLIGAWLGRRGSFLLQRRQQIVTAMQQGLGLSPQTAEKQFTELCENSGIAMQMAWQLAHSSRRWLLQQIIPEQQALVEEIGARGGVILSHHSYHQNLLISYFKTTGRDIFPIGNPPDAFSEDDYLYRFTLFLNHATETNLNGGRWLYNNQGKEFVRGIRQVLATRQILLVFCDFNELKKANPVNPFLGKTLQIPSGVIRLVEQEDVPVYFAGFYRQPTGCRYGLTLWPLREQNRPLQGLSLVDQYLAALEQHIRNHPASWQCWEIF